MYRNLMEVEQPIKTPTKIIIGDDATLKQRLIAIFFPTAIVGSMLY